VNTFIGLYDVALAGLRIALFWAAVALAVVFAMDWLVRTRRISPFSGVARFFRTSVDPLLAPVERRVVRAGGLPTSAPWWALVAVVVGGILLITLLGFLRNQIISVAFAVASGPGGILRMLISVTFSVLNIALLVRVFSSWFNVSPYSRWVRWSYALTEPILAPLRRVIPPLGMVDITPIVAYFLLRIFASLLVSAV
jgi:YggT family protein